MRRQAAAISIALSVVLSVSGCAVVDRDLRDARACEGLSQVSSLSTVDFQEEVRSLALPHASARLGRDLWDLSRLQGELNKGQVVPSPGLVRQIEQLTTRITLRCGEVGHLITGPVPTQGLEPNLSIGSDEEQTDEAAQVPAAPDLGGFSGGVFPLWIEPEDRTGYDRSRFEHWIDANGDGCDTRRTVSIEESLTPVQVGPGCDIRGGTWFSIYDGFTSSDPRDFDVDHVVALSEAWASGASAWSDQQRRDFANDLSYAGTLIAVSAKSNRSKGDKDPAGWMPPNDAFHCEYIEIWVEIKARWNLSADETEARAIEQVRAGC